MAYIHHLCPANEKSTSKFRAYGSGPADLYTCKQLANVMIWSDDDRLNSMLNEITNMIDLDPNSDNQGVDAEE